MALYRYVKDYSRPRRPARKKSFLLSFTLMGTGGLLLAWILWPILSFTAISDGLFAKTVTPIQDIAAVKTSANLSPVVLAAGNETVTTSTNTVDFTNANIWFPTAPQKKVVTPVNTYSISVPKLKISNALVVVGGDDLNKSLIHYGGTGLPGQYGTTVIFGHSTLPQFFSPTNYKTIFSTLPTLKVGDEIFVQYDGLTYRYEVYEMIVTEPNDLTPLEQRFDDSYVTLITCVPPGTYWKRLNVRAKLANL